MVRLARLVLAGELRRLLRDRRALFFAVVLPVVAFPLLFLFSGSIGDIGRDSLASRPVRVAADLSALDPAVAGELRASLAAPDLAIELLAVSHREAPDADRARAVLAEGHQLLMDARRPEGAEAPRLTLFFDDADELSDEALARVRTRLRDLQRRERDARLARLAGGDPGAPLEPRVEDVARPEDTAGRSLGGLLPLLAVLVLISGGSLAALDAFAGEREAGTLETLLVQPVPAAALAWGKFLVVLGTALTAFAGNAVSLLACLALGLGDLPGLPDQVAWGTASTRLALGCACFLPTAALVAAVLSLVAARARSFRQGQLLTMPLSFGALALAAPAMQPTTELGPLLALVPVTGGALALRDAAAGTAAAGPLALSLLASAGWAALALSRLTQTLDAERLLATPAAEAEAGARGLAAQRAVRLGLAAALLVYLGGGRLQASWPLGGLLASLWVLVVGLALVAATLCRERDQSLASALGLSTPRPGHLIGALFLAPGLALFVRQFFDLQQRLLPMPTSAGNAELTAWLDLPLPALLAILALSPAICEELLFRGALLGPMRRDFSALRVVLWQGLLFGIVHASIYRFLPLTLAGAFLAAVTLRTRSVVPAMVLHGSYNALLVLSAQPDPHPALVTPWLALLVVPAWLLLRAPARG